MPQAVATPPRSPALGLPDLRNGPIHARLKQARLGAGLTLAQMGRALGVSAQQIVKYESGQNRLCAARLPAWAGACGVTVEDLLGQSGPVSFSALGEGVASLVQAFTAISDASVRQALLETARALAASDRQRVLQLQHARSPS